MFTLEAIYNRLDAGTPGSKRTGGFTEPTSGPGSTGRTLDEVMGKAPAVDDTNGAGVADVLADKTFWGLTSGAWGTKTGTMTDREGDNASTAQAQALGVNYFTAPEGFYDGDDRVSATDVQVGALDANLSSDNIRSTVTIFGVTGTYPLAGVAKTGQTPTVPFSAPAGSDGNLQKGVTWPNPRFTANTGGETGTVTDNLTGLMWAQNANAAGRKNWDDALTYCNGLTLGGHDDWRLPNVKELQSLIDFAYYNPALSNAAGAAKWTSSGDAFTGVQSASYWSSTTYADNPDYAWYVHLYDGHVYYDHKTLTYCVWPVRGGQ